jgi:RNA polymerase sigma-70 factor, ECF subfamily
VKEELSDQEDGMLIAHALDGDNWAFDRLVEKHKGRLYAAALSVTSNSDYADDAVADALVRIYRASKQFKRQAKFSTWLHRIVVNAAKDILRRENRRAVQSLDEIGPEIDARVSSLYAPEVDSAWQGIAPTARKYLVSALASLSAEERELFLKVHRDGMTYGRLATTFEVPVGTIKSRMYRTRKHLRAHMPSLAELADSFG